MPPEARKSAQTILRNSIWYGLETIIEIVVFFASSIAVARYLGPEKLGYFVYINFFVSLLTRTAGQGVSQATSKYMLEFLATDRPGIAHGVYNLASRYQMLSSVAITTVGVVAVELRGDPAYRTMSVLLLLSIVPGLMSWVPAQANAAFEDFRPNTLSALGYLLTYAAVIFATVHFRWDLPGIASATLAGRTVELLLRIVPVRRRMRRLPLEPLEPALIRRIRRFAVQGIGLQLLTTVVWDRSEIIFLRYLSPAVQLGYYSVSFTFTANMLTAARVLASSASVTLMAEVSRGYERAAELARSTARFLLLVALPISMGAAAVALPVIHLAYGARYLPAVPVLIIAVLLGIPRALQGIPETALRTADRQNSILLWYSVTGVVNLALDWLLIPRYAAVGAAWGNGLGQLFGVVVIWIACTRVVPIRFPWSTAIRLTAASSVMAACAYGLSHWIPGLAGAIIAILAGCILYPFTLRLFRALEPGDRYRLGLVVDRLPRPMRPSLHAVAAFVTSTAV